MSWHWAPSAAPPPDRRPEAVTAGALRSYSTIYSIGVEWDVTGDADHDASATVEYRVRGTSAWQPALPLVRVDSNAATCSPAACCCSRLARTFGTANAMVVNLEECGGCGLAGWGWQDNGWGGVGVLGPEIYFAAPGIQRLRIQVREDGLGLDQIVLSAAAYLTAAPGASTNDTTILTR